MKITDIPQDTEPRVGDIIEIEQGEDCFEVRIIGITADGYLCEQDNIQGAVLLEGVDLDHSDVSDITGYIAEEKVRLDPKCWKGKKIGNPKTKMKGGVRVNNCVPEGRFDEPLTGWHIVYRNSGNPVHATPSFETKEQAQKYLMTKMFANHQDFKVVHTAGVGVSEGSDQYYAIVHKVTGKPLSTHRDLESAKDEWRGLDQDQRHFFKVVTTNKAPKDWSMKEAVAETSDYFRRREREEAIISGQKPARKKQPAQTSDYARRREQEKKAEKGVAEGVDIVKQDYDLDQMVYVLDVDGQKVSFTYWDYEDDFNNPDIKDIYQQAQEQLGKKLSPEQVKEVARVVFKSFEQGVAEGWGFDKWGHDTWTDAQKEVARKKKNEKQRAQRQQNKDQQNKDQQKSREQGVAEGGWDGTRGWEKRNPLGSDRLPQDSTSRADRMQAQDDELKQSHIKHVLKKYPKLKRSDLESKSLPELIRMLRGDVNEAEYQGRKVPLGKPMKGDVAKSKVYVRKPNGKVVKVNFGDKDMKIKKSNPKRRKSFRARHNCQNPGPRWKARYWSCRAW